MPTTVEIWHRARCLDCVWKARRKRLTVSDAKKDGVVHRLAEPFHRLEVVTEETRTSRQRLK